MDKSEEIRRTRRKSIVYLNADITEAFDAYKAAGVPINLSRTAATALIDKFIEIERARRAIGEPFLYTYEQLTNMKIKMLEATNTQPKHRG